MLRVCVCVCLQVRLHEVYSRVAFLQRRNPEQHEPTGHGGRSDPINPGPSGKAAHRPDQTTFLLRSLSSLMFHFDNPLICHRIHSFMSQLLLSGEAEICQTECSGASSFGCQPPSGSPGLADPGAPESCTLRRSKSKVIHHV